MRNLKISVLGDGGWGTTLAILLNKKGFGNITLWSAFAEYCAFLNKTRINKKYLPGIPIPKEITITSSLEDSVCRKDLIIIAVPSQYARGVLKNIADFNYSKDAIYLSVTKGIEIGTLKRMSEIIKEELGDVKIAVLSGPTIAHEVAQALPSTAVIASDNAKIRKHLQAIFSTPNFRIYTNQDVIGIELGGSIKNIIAIACGISDGLGFGTNTKAAILSRGLSEISRLGKAMGAQTSTFSGLSGLGDLVTTCISMFSRNRQVGEQIGKGKTLKEIAKNMQMVAEGVPTAKSVYQLSRKFNVEMPITREVYQVLYKNKSPLKAVKNLMLRESKEE